MAYIELNSWYNAQEFFRWIRDKRYLDQYDLTPKKSFSNSTRQEQLPDWAKEPVDYSSNKPKVTDEDLRRFLEDVGDTEGF